MIVFLNRNERDQLLILVRRELDDTYPSPHKGTLDKINFLHKLKSKLS